MLEKDFQKRVTDMADRFGWSWWHTPAPMVAAGKEWRPYKKGAGVADLILIHDSPPRLIFMELKGDGGKLSDNQSEFLRAAKTVADDSFSWMLDVSTVRAIGPDHYKLSKPFGVYAFWPKDEPLIEQLLRTKVLT
jgi:hypothetical protein